VTKSQLIDLIASRLQNISRKDVETAVEMVFESITQALSRDERVEIRGFGSFTTRVRQAREGRNPKTGEKVFVEQKRTPFFTVGKEMRERVNNHKSQ